MSSPNNDPIARLEQLERESADLKERLKRTTGEVHLLQWMFVAVVAAAIGVPVYYIQNGKINTDVLFDQGVSKSLEAEEIGLHNRDHKRVMFIDYDRLGMPYQLFFDPRDMNCKLALYTTNGHGELRLFEANHTRAALRMGEENESRLELLADRKQGGKGAIVLTMSRDGTPRLTMTDASGKVVFEAPAPSANSDHAELKATDPNP
jgi:hypothetical protein